MFGKKIKTVRLTLILCAFLLLPLNAYAHGVHLSLWVEGDRVHTDSTLPSGKKVVGGMIRVYDPSGTKLLDGMTDEKGAFTFKIPKRTDLRIVLEASMGHRTEFLLPAEEMGGVEKRPLTAGKIKDPHDLPSTPVQGDIEQIRKVLEEVIDARLRPITRKLALLEQESGPKMTDIIGGIGYLFGLMGLVLYFKNRTEK